MATESVKIKTEKVNIVREVKKKTGSSIGRIIEDAIDKVHGKKSKTKEPWIN